MPPVDLAVLSQKGSLFATRPTLFTYVDKREDLEAGAAAVFDVISKGIVKVQVNQRHALKDVAQAHRDLEARRTTGATLLIP
jgi:NADPH2:quinone reductase